MGRGDVYVQPNAADPVLDEGTVVDLALRHTKVAGRVLDVDESGGEARAYLLEGDVVVKVQRPHRVRPRTSLAKESAILRHLAGRLGGRVPRFLGHGKTQTPLGDVEYLVMTRLPGQPVARNPQEGRGRSRLIGEVGALLAQLHAIGVDATQFPSGLLPGDRDGRELAHRLDASFADAVELIEQQRSDWPIRAAPAEVAAMALTTVPEAFTPVLLHSNPGPTHVFCTTDGALTGLIDFGDSYRSHPALDLHRWPDPADRVILREGYLAGARPSRDFDNVWNAAMALTDMVVLAKGSELSGAAAVDLELRIAAMR